MLLVVTLVTGFTETLKTHIQVLQTVPAEGVFAALAQHLRAALVPLDVGATHGALLDRQVRTAVGDDPAQPGREQQRGTCVRLNPGSYARRHAGLIILRAEERSLFSSRVKGQRSLGTRLIILGFKGYDTWPEQPSLYNRTFHNKFFFLID